MDIKSWPNEEPEQRRQDMYDVDEEGVILGENGAIEAALRRTDRSLFDFEEIRDEDLEVLYE